MRDGAQIRAHLSWLVKGGSRENVRTALESLAESLIACGIVAAVPPPSPLLEVALAEP
jgi:hypothetical protein